MKKKLIKTAGWNQLINENLLFGVDFEENNSPKKSKKINKRKIPYENVTIRKRKELLASTSEKRLKELSSI